MPSWTAQTTAVGGWIIRTFPLIPRRSVETVALIRENSATRGSFKRTRVAQTTVCMHRGASVRTPKAAVVTAQLQTLSQNVGALQMLRATNRSSVTVSTLNARQTLSTPREGSVETAMGDAILGFVFPALDSSVWMHPSACLPPIVLCQCAEAVSGAESVVSVPQLRQYLEERSVVRAFSVMKTNAWLQHQSSTMAGILALGQRVLMGKPVRAIVQRQS